jgi:Putative lumazine-binding
MRIAIAVLLIAGAAAQVGASDDERTAIEAVVKAAYVDGVHANFDPQAMRKGFDPAFRMQVLREGKVLSLTLDEWIARMEKSAQENPAPKPVVRHEFKLVDVSGTAAVARVELWRDGKHVFTDYLSLYKLPEGWKIAAKTFYAHPK